MLECIIFNDDAPIMSRSWIDILRFQSHQIAIITINVEQMSSWSYGSQTYNCPLRFLSFTPIRSDVYLITDSSDGFFDFRKVVIFYLVLK